MDINFNCIGCGQLLIGEERHAGMEVQCPKCNARMKVPSRTPAARPLTPSAPLISSKPPVSGRPSPITRPPFPGKPPTPGPARGPGPTGFMPQKTPAKGKGLAIVSMIIGIGSALMGFIPVCNYFALIPAIVGLILGIIAVRQLNRVRAPKGIGVAGLILNAIAIALILVWTLVIATQGEKVGEEIKTTIEESIEGLAQGSSPRQAFDKLKEACKNKDYKMYEKQLTKESIKANKELKEAGMDFIMPVDLKFISEYKDKEKTIIKCMEIDEDGNKTEVEYIFVIENGVWKFDMKTTMEKMFGDM